MTIPTTNVTMSSINKALNRVSNTQITFSSQVSSINSANTLGSTRGRVKEYFCLLKGDGTNGSTSIPDYTDTFSKVSGTATISTATSKFGSASIRSDNSTSFFTVSNAPVNINLSSYTGDWTIEGFCYWQTGADIARFLSAFNGSNDASIRINNLLGTGVLQAYYFEGGSLRNINGSAAPQNQWFHFAFVRQSTTLYLYRDGVSQGSTSISGSALDMDAFTIGQEGGEFFTGYLDEIRFSSICRYPNGTTFTPPTSSFAS
jgi:hypothetical protein